MRIVDLYKMSEEERKKALEEQQSLYNERMRQSEEIGRQANQQFNDLISRQGEYDTSKHTTTIGDLRKAYKDSNSFQTVNNSLNNYSKNNSPSIWEKMGYIMDNFGTGVHQGTVGIAQGLFTDSANEMRKGKEKNNNELFNNFINAYAGNDLHHIAQSTLNTINEGINILNDKDKNLWQKMVDINLNTVSNGAKALLPMQGFYSSANQVIGKVSDTDQQLLEMNKNISEPLEERKKELANEGEKYDGATKFLGEAGQVIGNMIPSITASAITKNPSVALGVMGASVKGQATQEALDKGMSLDKATQIGDAKALIEVATEKLSGGTKVFGHGSLDDIAEELVKKGAKSKAGKFIMTQLLNAGGEIAEEEISNVLGNAIDKGTTDPDKKVLDMKEAFETMGSTAFTTTMLNLLTGGMVNDYRQISNNINQYKDTNTGEILDNNSQDILKQAENIINENSTPNLQQQSTQNEQILPIQQINQEQNNVVQNENMEQILPTQKYYYEKSDNVKIDNLRQDVNKYFDNSEKTHNFVNMLEKIIEDKDINIRLDENLTDTNGNIANGKYDNGTITINPNSDRAGEFIAIHELTHAIGTDSMRNIIENYRKSNVEFDNAVKSLLKNYNTTELTDEAMADVSAQLFGNQEYINNLAQTNPSLFRKIYNEIKYLWHQFTGYKNQNQFLEDLKYKWEQAYRRNNELNDTSNYYIQPLEEFNEMQYNDTKGLKLNNIEEYALREIVNSDSNIKPGINKVETTNATYTIYYKSTDDFKVITRKVDKSAGKLNKRNDYTRGKARYSLPYSESNGNQETARSNDEISNINKTRESERTGSTTSSSDNIRNSIENSEKSSFNLSENMQKRLNELKSIDTSKMGFLERAKIKHEIRSLEAGFNTVEEYEKVEREKREKALKEAEKEREERRKKIKQQEKEHEGYQMTHRPTESGAYASDISANGFIPKDVYEHPEWYFDMNRDFSKESFEVIKKIKGNPEAEITIYRATPSNTINKGDWVTLSRKYAEYHNESNLGGKGNIVELRVKAKDIQYAGDDINEFGYFPENEKYSLTTKDWQSYLDKNIESKGTKTNLQDIKLPIKKQLLPTNNLANNNVNENTITNNYAQSNENDTQNEEYQTTKGETINWNEIERPEGKIRKHYRSIIESSNTTKEAKAIAKELMGIDTYMPDSNKKQLERANVRIENSTPDSELDSLMSRAKSGDKIDATDIAVGERLIQYYSKVGDKVKLRDSIQATAMAGTTAGQTVQAMALLNHQTPEGQVVWIQRSIEKLNNKMKNKKGDKAQQFEFTPEMQEKILNSKNKAELEQNLDEVYRELGQQVHKSFGQQVDSWRYFAMLGNPRTHIRNIVGNFLMGKAQGVKNKVAGTIEGTVAKFNPDMERTHTIVPASKEVLEFAKNDIENVASELELNENKYHPQSRIESNMRTFKSNAMENTLGRIFDINDTALEAEDGWGLKAGYKKALAEYMTANKLTPENITDTQLAKGRKYAIQQAKEATFHQANVVASAVNSFINKNKVTKAVGDALVPFVKTPANVAKAGVEYSPVGLTKSLIYDSIQLRKGNITVNQYIDNISKGLTGSAITVLGYALAQAGILKASGSDDDKKEKFDQQSGKQAYSIQIGDNTYTIDWLAPVGIPLMVGAEIYEGLSQKSKVKNSKSNDDNEITKQFLDRAEVLANSLSSTLDPMVEMSMISSLTSAIKSFAQNDTEALANMMTNGAKSYLNQFVPTLLGQVAKTTDTVERDTTSTATGTISKAIDSTANQIKSKIPGLRQMLPTRKDIWGNDVKLADNWAQRFFEAGILPASKKQINNDKVVKILNDLYDKNGDSKILPSTIEKSYTIDGQKYTMTNSEYNKYKTDYGKTSYNLIKELINSSDFKNLSNEQKGKAIENVYSYAKESNKLDYAKNNNLEVDKSTLYNTMQELKDKGGNQSLYLNYTARTTGIEKERDKNKVLASANYDDKTKSIIYLNGTGKDDKLYNNIKNSNMDINQYLSYKIQESEDKFLADKDSNGKSISGTAKKKIYNYVNTNITGYNNKLLLLGQKYKLTKSEQEGLAKHIYQISSNTEERNELFKYYSKNFTIKNGKAYYK